ncbi:type II toxin-antitoxin system HicA family toxin [Nitrosomonas sp.]|uniref:type II toxin-antitoxin system HicA family toxin n=1 Tax=Nitrosomonas sp. TaxID=42353 RepID=UPI0035229A82
MGFSVEHQRGSHIVLRKGSSGCVVPNHHELKVGTLSGILKQAGVSPDEFIKVLRP